MVKDNYDELVEGTYVEPGHDVAYIHWVDLIGKAKEKIDLALDRIVQGRDADALPHIKEAIRLLQASISL